jgi:hypothetical protein
MAVGTDKFSPSASIMAIAARNRRESTLLSLPDEVLSNILRHAVGGQVVHVNPGAGQEFKTRACIDPLDCTNSFSPRLQLEEEVETEPCIYCNDYDIEGTNFAERHTMCSEIHIVENTRQSLNLDVLRVCHQIYKVGAMLPFKQNQFVFRLHQFGGQTLTMDGFIDHLQPWQREAVRDVAIVSHESQRGDKEQIGRLTGLRYLHMLFSTGWDPVELYKRLEQTWGLAPVDPLKWLPLKDFRITMEACVSLDDFGILNKQAAELRRLIGHIEARTLRWNSHRVRGQTLLANADDREFQEDASALKQCVRKLQYQRFEWYMELEAAEDEASQ